MKRFWSKVLKKRKKECWPWLAGQGHNGYGRFNLDGEIHQAHRVAFLLHNKRWPKNDACHRCDNRLCCNPHHLFEATRAENNLDRHVKGRDACKVGELNDNVKLNQEQVLHVKKLLKIGIGGSAVSRLTGINIPQVSLIKRNKTWSHLN